MSQIRQKYPDFHVGMLAIYNAQDWKIVNEQMEFQYCYFHKGVNESHTAGCQLTGYNYYGLKNGKQRIGRSEDAYIDLYKKVSAEILQSGPVPYRIWDHLPIK